MDEFLEDGDSELRLVSASRAGRVSTSDLLRFLRWRALAGQSVSALAEIVQPLLGRSYPRGKACGYSLLTRPHVLCAPAGETNGCRSSPASTSTREYRERVLENQEATVSIRWVFPFIRVTGTSPADIELLMREGVSLKDFANPDFRVRHRVMMELLTNAVKRLGMPDLGLRAAERVEAGDFETLEYASRSCAAVRQAILCTSRYMYLMHGAQEARLIEHGDLASWQLRITDGVEQPPAANDFALASACWFIRRYTAERGYLREVHFMHEVPTNQAEYERIFEGAQIKLGKPRNALVFTRAHLDAPMSLAHPGLQAAFELHANAVLERLKRSDGVGGRVRELLAEQLRAGDVSMTTVAHQLGMSVATLRRRLREESTSHSELLEDVRRELSQRYLADRTLAISEVAFLLGFSHVTAFYKAFRRWFEGTTPADFRAQAQLR
ncbi:MAG: Transcriptional regulator, AraC family [Myxococcaceae bacterium]|nr:Transcriptional regulator, AraC family [Myxococcaceae bacterium]